MIISKIFPSSLLIFLPSLILTTTSLHCMWVRLGGHNNQLLLKGERDELTDRNCKLNNRSFLIMDKKR